MGEWADDIDGLSAPARAGHSPKPQDAPATTNSTQKPPVATLSVAEIQQVRSNLFRMGLHAPVCDSYTADLSSRNAHMKLACGSRNVGLLRARLEDIIVDPTLGKDLGAGGSAAMSKGTIPLPEACKILRLGDWQGANRATAGTLQGSPSTKVLKRYWHQDSCTCQFSSSSGAVCQHSVMQLCQAEWRKCTQMQSPTCCTRQRHHLYWRLWGSGEACAVQAVCATELGETVGTCGCPE